MHTDGGSRGNPGPSAIGFSITREGEVVCEGGWPIGEGTNNEAEYEALIWGLRNALAMGVSDIEAVADSELMVRQINGEYKVRNARLKELHSEAAALIARFDRFEISHVPRRFNRRSDELVNEALDSGGPVGNWKAPFGKEEPGELFAVGSETVPYERPVSRERLVRTVVLGVTGCIAAYKSCEILRCLQKAGIRVKVLMTENATRFVGPATFRALTREPVAVGLFDAAGDPIHHISLAKEADLLLVAPATANVLVKLAAGIADSLLTTTALACNCPIAVAPAMNTAMWLNPRVQDAVSKLRSRGVIVVGPDDGYLSCGDVGEGKLAKVRDIVEAAIAALPFAGPLSGKRVMVTSGPTHEPIDPVRFIGNRSSGITGTLIATAAREAGAEVTLVTGPTSQPDPIGVEVVRVQTALEMLEAAREPFLRCDAAVFCAAVADFRPASPASRKIKKDSIGRPGECQASMTLELVGNPDILATLAAHKGDRFVVGFAAETGDPIAAARSKLTSKNADLIVANDVSDPSLGFGTEDNRVWLVSDELVRDTGRISKAEEAKIVVDEIARRFSPDLEGL